jgi:SCY1-like protein 2
LSAPFVSSNAILLAAKSSEAQASFLRGILPVLPQFSTKVNRLKVLPSLLAETHKANLVPFLLPNILFISNKMDNEAFREEVLPSLKPLFTLREPPQAVVSLLKNLGMLNEKCSAAVFREGASFFPFRFLARLRY